MMADMSLKGEHAWQVELSGVTKFLSADCSNGKVYLAPAMVSDHRLL